MTFDEKWGNQQHPQRPWMSVHKPNKQAKTIIAVKMSLCWKRKHAIMIHPVDLSVCCFHKVIDVSVRPWDQHSLHKDSLCSPQNKTPHPPQLVNPLLVFSSLSHAELRLHQRNVEPLDGRVSVRGQHEAERWAAGWHELQRLTTAVRTPGLVLTNAPGRNATRFLLNVSGLTQFDSSERKWRADKFARTPQPGVWGMCWAKFLWLPLLFLECFHFHVARLNAAFKSGSCWDLWSVNTMCRAFTSVRTGTA